MSKLNSASTKVCCACSAIYVWILKSWNFDKLHKVGVSPTQVPFQLRVVNGLVGQTRP